MAAHPVDTVLYTRAHCMPALNSQVDVHSQWLELTNCLGTLYLRRPVL
jgi:hypothetical protein